LAKTCKQTGDLVVILTNPINARARQAEEVVQTTETTNRLTSEAVEMMLKLLVDLVETKRDKDNQSNCEGKKRVVRINDKRSMKPQRRNRRSGKGIMKRMLQSPKR
jgi:hypothetical protein